MLLDGHDEADPSNALAAGYEEAEAGSATDVGAEEGGGPVLLSLADGQFLVPQPFYHAAGLSGLTWLDFSGLQGSLKHLIMARSSLPNLRVLKVRRRELTATEACHLLDAFGQQLWSLDVSDNPLGDTMLDRLSECMIRSPALRSGVARFDVEGIVEWPTQRGTLAYGPFYHIAESNWSPNFNHPERYLADSPSYRHGGQADGDAAASVRSNGRTPIVDDSVDFLKHALTRELSATSLDAVISMGRHLRSRGTAIGLMTHLHLSNTSISSFGLEKLIRVAGGQLEFLDCDTARIRNHSNVWPSSWPRSSKLHGILGAAHLFRPVFSSNLRCLRVHHSLVTQVPSLEADGLSSLARIFLAETILRARSEMAYPRAAAVLLPDTNPRITSLTLTKIPRRSYGPIVDALIRFLKLASVQERGIAEATVSSSSRAPVMLRGLRKIVLEFESDPMEDPAGISSVDDLDAEGLLLNMGQEEGGFSFFADEYRRDSKQGEGDAREKGAAISPASTGNSGLANHNSGHVEGDFAPDGDGNVEYSDRWQGNVFRVRVWVGSEVGGGGGPVNAYMRNVRDLPQLRRTVGPATPSHVAAGVPAGSLIFLDAWNEMLVPAEEMRPPSRQEMARMVDVLGEIKKFRAATRTAYARLRAEALDSGHPVALGPPHYFWTGAMEAVVHNSMAHYHASQYWR